MSTRPIPCLGLVPRRVSNDESASAERGASYRMIQELVSAALGRSDAQLLYSFSKTSLHEDFEKACRSIDSAFRDTGDLRVNKPSSAMGPVCRF